MKKWTVADVMTTDVVAVPEDATYRTIVELLAERRISAVLVVDVGRRASSGSRWSRRTAS